MSPEWRTRISRAETGIGIALFAAVVLHYGWCAFSLPRHGIVTSHGLETAACNWGTTLLATLVGGLAVLTAATGALAHWLRSRVLTWWLVQVPALGAWGWLLLEMVDAFVRHA